MHSYSENLSVYYEATAISDSLCLTFWAVPTSFVSIKYLLTKNYNEKKEKEIIITKSKFF